MKFKTLALAAASVASIGTAAHSRQDTSGDAFKDRITTTNADRSDYAPKTSGYFKLVITPNNLQNNTFCPTSKKEANGWAAAATGIWKEFIGETKESGLLLRMWLGDSTDETPKIERSLFRVERIGKITNSGWQSCKPDLDTRASETPLMPFDGPTTRITYQWETWHDTKVNDERVKKITDATSSLLAYVGAPVPTSVTAFANTRFTEFLKAKGSLGLKADFDTNVPEGGRIVTLAISATAKPNVAPTGNEPSVSVRLVTVGSLFAPAAPSFTDLSSKTRRDVLRTTTIAGKSVVDWLKGDASTVDDYVSKLESANAADLAGRCRDLFDELDLRTSLSAPDAALVVLALVSEKPGGFTANGTTWVKPLSQMPRDAPFLRTACADVLRDPLSKLSITVPVAVDPLPETTPASAQQMRAAMEVVNKLAGSDEEPLADEQGTIKLAFGPRVVLNDPSNLLAGAESRSVDTASGFVELIGGSFKQLGCWLPDQNADRVVPWPPGYAPSDPATSKIRMSSAIGLLQSTQSAVLIRFVFEAAPIVNGKTQSPRISAITVSNLGDAEKGYFRSEYQTKSCSLKSTFVASAPAAPPVQTQAQAAPQQQTPGADAAVP